jgi:zinc D-Ala-D-Ala carboxypeptidase
VLTNISPPARLRALRLLLVLALLIAGCGATRHSAGTLSGDPFDDGDPTIRRLDPSLRQALRSAARDAQGDGVRMVVTSGWRSRAHQERLLDRAIEEHGSEEEARRYVATPDTSAHVTGDAVEIAPSEADEWLSRHGSAYGLCQVFANEDWHFELATTPGGRCPEMYPDSSYRH